ncbi:hypothetical protein MVG78_11470 [Roseomonas gilardii subsp. gilardii]|uniref:hypothetical protein n=1 Tax=Roseomonas gilardii TaxID=257708 RepID=UPI001FF8E6A1|nr:hypothetical protein [Roseomonas gilardii]UPG71219.1 hypothetical protein MVG78_11470 [Roseomonas gilardii subsp. gilardii]
MEDLSPTRILLLGGSTEASALAIVLAGDERFDVVLSLAGATRSPVRSPCRCGAAASAAWRGWRPSCGPRRWTC